MGAAETAAWAWLFFPLGAAAFIVLYLVVLFFMRAWDNYKQLRASDDHNEAFH